ncbi:MAG: hypothetical protein Q7S58_00640 [Candidatus Binatus sp.]|uniref:hypothetical protein n=1 Tax=Candidatus Binatus sp. TaxID=2811406 RepID=UPI00271D794E|nr:hypothetical protein [Candidatus Binatus sp.]MDO8430893.1 hypothetical protein [Candidatus Binatus sp.]
MVEGIRLLSWPGDCNGIGSDRIASENARVSQNREPSHHFGFARLRHKKTLFLVVGGFEIEPALALISGWKSSRWIHGGLVINAGRSITVLAS